MTRYICTRVPQKYGRPRIIIAHARDVRVKVCIVAGVKRTQFLGADVQRGSASPVFLIGKIKSRRVCTVFPHKEASKLQAEAEELARSGGIAQASGTIERKAFIAALAC